MKVLLVILSAHLLFSAILALRGRMDSPLMSWGGAWEIIQRVCCGINFVLIAALMWKGGLA